MSFEKQSTAPRKKKKKKNSQEEFLEKQIK